MQNLSKKNTLKQIKQWFIQKILHLQSWMLRHFGCGLFNPLILSESNKSFCKMRRLADNQHTCQCIVHRNIHLMGLCYLFTLQASSLKHDDIITALNVAYLLNFSTIFYFGIVVGIALNSTAPLNRPILTILEPPVRRCILNAFKIYFEMVHFCWMTIMFLERALDFLDPNV